MSRFEDIQSNVSERGKALIETVVDYAEWALRKNLAVANDSTEFAVTQLRLPAEVADFASYRRELRSSYSNFGSVLREHGEEVVAKLREVPEDVREALTPRQVKVPAPRVRKPAARKTSKKAAPKTPASRAAARKKVAPKTVARKKAAPRKVAATQVA